MKSQGKLSLDYTDLEEMAVRSLAIATKIESCLFCDSNEEISKEYGKRFRDLLVGLKNDENVELRRGMILGSIKPADFVRYEKDKLIPKSLVMMREQS